jgi:hypothetical protein
MPDTENRTSLIRRAKRKIAHRTYLSGYGIRQKPWKVEQRSGENIVKGTAIGFSYTDRDASLIPGMMKSFDFVEFVVSYYDDNSRANFEFNEAERHKAIIRKARRKGAKYFWGVGPKRRLGEISRQEIIDNLHWCDEGYALFTHYRFFWGRMLKHLRIDSFWGERKTSAFFPLLTTNKYKMHKLHHPWHPKNIPRKYIEANQYYIGRHTKKILKKKFGFYKSHEYKVKFWQENSIDDLIAKKIVTIPVDEKIIGIGLSEYRFKG